MGRETPVKNREQLAGQFGEIARFLTPEIGQQFDAVEVKLAELAGELSARPVEELKDLRKDIKEMIECVTRRGDAADAERFKFLQSSLQIIGFILVVFSLVITGLDKAADWSRPAVVVLLSLGLSLVVAVFGALAVIVMYFAQARFRYPFIYYRQLGNSWRWFYYGNIKSDTPEGEFAYRNQAYQRLYAMNYAADLEEYATRYIRDQLHRQVVDDLRQLFLLMEHDRYKQRFKQHMVHASLYTGCAVAAALVGGLVGGFYLGAR